MALGSAALWRGLAKPSRYAVLVAGALPVLAFPRLNLEFLGWCGLVPGMLVIRRSPSAREAAVRGWWFGAGFLLAALYWLVPDIGPALLLIAVVFGALWTGFGVAAWGLLRPPVNVPRALAAIIVVPSYWLLTEWARSWQGFGGPWAVLGTSQWQHPAILGLAAVGGVWLVSFALVAANTGILVALAASLARSGTDLCRVEVEATVTLATAAALLLLLLAVIAGAVGGITGQEASACTAQPAASSAAIPGSSFAATPRRRVMPKAVSRACIGRRSAKKLVSVGLAPG